MSAEVRPSRVCGEREKTKEDRIDEKKNANTAGPKTIRRPDHRRSQHGHFLYTWRNEDVFFFHKTDKFSIDASDFCICYQHVQKLECLGERVR